MKNNSKPSCCLIIGHSNESVIMLKKMLVADYCNFSSTFISRHRINLFYFIYISWVLVLWYWKILVFGVVGKMLVHFINSCKKQVAWFIFFESICFMSSWIGRLQCSKLSKLCDAECQGYSGILNNFNCFRWM